MEAQAQMVDLSRLVPSTVSRRKKLEDLDGLAESIRSQGILQPLRGRPYRSAKRMDGAELVEVIFGHRRFEAATKAGLQQVPVIVQEATDDQVRRMQAAENLQRQNPTPLEEAEAYQELEDAGLPPAEIAATVGRSLSYVLQRRKLLALSSRCRKALARGQVTVGVAEYLARMLPRHEDQEHALDRMADGRFASADAGIDPGPPTLDVAREVIAELIRPLAHAPFAAELGDKTLVPKAGSCNDCPKRTGTQRDLFGADSKDDRCLDESCWDQKIEAFNARLSSGIKAMGGEVLSQAHSNRILDAETGEVKAGSGWLDPSDKANGKTSWSTLLAELPKKVPTSVAFDSHKRPHLVVREADARKALERAGVKLPPAAKTPGEAKAKKGSAKKTSSSSDWKEKWEREEAARKVRESEAKVLEGAAVEVFDQVLEHVSGKGLGEGVLRVLVELAVADMKTSWSLKTYSKERRERVVRACAGKLHNAKELLVALVDGVAYQAVTGVDFYSVKKGLELDAQLVALAKAAGVDWKPVVVRHQAEAKLKADEAAARTAEAAAKKKGGKKAAKKGA